MAEASILYSTTTGVGTITLNRPDNRNGMTKDMADRLYDRLAGLRVDQTIDVVVVRGAGRDFCVGADIQALPDGPGARPTPPDPAGETFQIPRMLHDLPQVTIAAIRGGCAGAGLGWAMACDFRFASKRSVFNTAFMDVAVAGDMGCPWTLSRLVGAAHARELMFFPGKIASEEAHRLGLVSRLFPDERLDAEVEALAVQLAARSVPALRATKANFLAAERLGFEDFCAMEGAVHRLVCMGPDPAEAFRAFAEKRPPVFGRDSGLASPSHTDERLAPTSQSGPLRR